MSQKVIPDHSPLIACDLICHGCGAIMKPEIIRNNRNVVQYLEYKHRNEVSGCSYTIQSNVMINAEMKPMRADGSEAKI
jgi:hypothetical protein